MLALLSLTLPLQGALAATMGVGMALMSSHDAAVVATMPTDCADMADMADMSHDRGATAAMHHEMAGMDHAGMAVTDDAAPHHAASGHASDHHCGICLQCCLGVAIPIAPLSLAAGDLRDVTPTLRALDAPEPAPRPFERPPKTFLA